MNLADNKFQQIKKDKQVEIYKVTGTFSHTLIAIVIWKGASSDPVGKNGISHLCEHILIKKVSQSYLEEVYDKRFGCSGATDYTFTLFRFFLSNKYLNINIIMKKIETFLLNPQFTWEDLESCKKEVLQELGQKRNKTKITKTIYKFLTSDVVEKAPIGRERDINNISQYDVMNYLKQYTSHISIGVLMDDKNNSLKLNYNWMGDRKGVFHISETKNLHQKLEEYQNHVFILKGIQGTERCLFYIAINCKWQLNRDEDILDVFSRVILNIRIEKQLKRMGITYKYIAQRKKRIDKERYYIVFEISGGKGYKERMGVVLNKVMNFENMDEKDIDEAKKNIKTLIGELEKFGTKEIYENMLKHIVYKEYFVFTEHKARKLLNYIEKIDCNSVKWKLKNYCYWNGEIYQHDLKIFSEI